MNASSRFAGRASSEALERIRVSTRGEGMTSSTARTSGATRCRVLLVSVIAAAAISLLAVSAASAKPSAPARHAEGKTLNVGLQDPFTIVPLFVAQHLGYLKKYGISGVSYRLFSTFPPMLAAAAQGQLDIAIQTPPVVTAYNKATSSNKLKFLYLAEKNSLVWVARKGVQVPIATAKNWKSTVLAWRGKKVGIPAPGGIIQKYTDALAREAGLNPGSDFQYVVTGSSPTTRAAILAGQVDIACSDASLADELDGGGYTILSMPQGQGPKDLLELLVSTYVAGESQIGNNPNLYRGLTAALAKAQAFMAKPRNKKAVMSVLVKTLEVSPSQAALLYRDSTIFQGKITPSLYNKTMATGIANGFIVAPAPLFTDAVANF
jgi:ABC-type nitrate/sulfonate/bicarbonate transport system substrate-binding protein